MSATATAWAWSCDVPHTNKLILLAFAEDADSSGHTALHRATIEAMTGLSETTVRTAVTKLADEGFLTRVNDAVRKDPKDGQNALVPLYRLELGRAATA